MKYIKAEDIKDIIDEYKSMYKRVTGTSIYQDQSFEMEFNYYDDSVDIAIDGCQAFEEIMRKLVDLINKEEK